MVLNNIKEKVHTLPGDDWPDNVATRYKTPDSNNNE